MSNEEKAKSARAMTDKIFLYRSQGKAAVSAKSFLEAHRQFLLTGTLRPLTEPLLVKLDKGEALPTPTLNEVRNAVYTHMVNETITEGIKKITKSESGEHHTNKNYIATIFDSQGNVCTRVKPDGFIEDLVKGFDDGEHAKGWVDRRLFDGCLDWYGTVVHQKITIKGEPMMELVQRADSIARLLRKKKTPAIHEKSKSTPSLGFGVRAKQDRASFSRG
jgi:hypothetical protein